MMEGRSLGYCYVCHANSPTGEFNREVVGICREHSKPVYQKHADGCIQDGHGYDAFIREGITE